MISWLQAQRFPVQRMLQVINCKGPTEYLCGHIVGIKCGKWGCQCDILCMTKSKREYSSMSQAEQLCTSCTRGWESADAIRIIKVTTKYKQGEIKCKQSGTKIKLRTKKMILCIFLMIKIKTAASLPDRICDPNILGTFIEDCTGDIIYYYKGNKNKK